jgi:hypothetical protein
MGHFTRRKLQWINLASAIDLAVPREPTLGEATPGVCDARLLLTDGPLEDNVSLHDACVRVEEEVSGCAQLSQALQHLWVVQHLP